MQKHKYTTETFIEKAREIHGDKYDYSKVEYINSHTKVCIICPEHGEFWQIPNAHLNGQGCPKCGIKRRSDIKRKSKEQFISECIRVHGNKYNYSKVNYVSNHDKVCIICPEHGEFFVTPISHIFNKIGCEKCKKENVLKQENEKKVKEIEKQKNIKLNILSKIIERAKKTHCNKYDYSKSVYTKYKDKICVICPEHGEFFVTPHDHINGRGCPKCSFNKRKTGNKVFIEKSISVHGIKYDYSKVNYVNAHDKVCIICPEHGEFWQEPNEHLKGCGCKICGSSKLENEILNFLNEKNIIFECQRQFEWLGLKRLDFYLPEYNVAIECQGIQHFRPINFFGGNNGLEYTIKRDEEKKKLCEENGIEVFYYSNLDIDYPYKVFTNKDTLINEIKTHGKIFRQ